MKKIYLLHLVAIVLICSFIGTSCKKPSHSNNPIPNNSRLSSYSRITTTTATNGIATVLSENFSFYYDPTNRVIKMTYTNNDGLVARNENTVYDYTHDTVIKTVTNILNNSLIEKDTLVYNSQGQLATAFTPNLTTTFQYYGKLLASYTIIGRNNKGTTVKAVTTYTSVNGDLLKHDYDGNLVANLSTNRKGPYDIKWIMYNGTITTQNTSSATTTLANYNESPVVFASVDYNGVIDNIAFPGELWRKESYHFYTEMANRPGDYMWIQSFTQYGSNVYQNAHLVESISSMNRHANIDYSIDAFSHITQARVVTIDSVLNKYNYVYDYQYEVY